MGLNYYVFNYEPPINDWGFTFLQNPKYAAATDSVILSITEADLNQVPEQVFNKGVSRGYVLISHNLLNDVNHYYSNFHLFPDNNG